MKEIPWTFRNKLSIKLLDLLSILVLESSLSVEEDFLFTLQMLNRTKEMALFWKGHVCHPLMFLLPFLQHRIQRKRLFMPSKTKRKKDEFINKSFKKSSTLARTAVFIYFFLLLQKAVNLPELVAVWLCHNSVTGQDFIMISPPTWRCVNLISLSCVCEFVKTLRTRWLTVVLPSPSSYCDCTGFFFFFIPEIFFLTDTDTHIHFSWLLIHCWFFVMADNIVFVYACCVQFGATLPPTLPPYSTCFKLYWVWVHFEWVYVCVHVWVSTCVVNQVWLFFCTSETLSIIVVNNLFFICHEFNLGTERMERRRWGENYKLIVLHSLWHALTFKNNRETRCKYCFIISVLMSFEDEESY